jgi:hypothetical protein
MSGASIQAKKLRIFMGNGQPNSPMAFLARVRN